MPPALTSCNLGFPGTMTEQQSPPEQMATGEGAGERGGNYKVYWAILGYTGDSWLWMDAGWIRGVQHQAGTSASTADGAGDRSGLQLPHSSSGWWPCGCCRLGSSWGWGSAAWLEGPCSLPAKDIGWPGCCAAAQGFNPGDEVPWHSGISCGHRHWNSPGVFVGLDSARGLVEGKPAGEDVVDTELPTKLLQDREGWRWEQILPVGERGARSWGCLLLWGAQRLLRNLCVTSVSCCVVCAGRNALVSGSGVAAGTPLGQCQGVSGHTTDPPGP